MQHSREAITLSVKERLNIARHPLRPKGKELISMLADSMEELHGDRFFGDDKASYCGVLEIEGRRCIFVAQDKGQTIQQKKECNFGMMNPEGFRKAKRLMKLAERFSLPIITVVDTPGANPHIEAEKRGQARAIAENLLFMSGVKTPVISIILGEGSSGGALGVCISDRIIMLEHAYFSVINPEGCASILWKDRSMAGVAARQLKMQSECLEEFAMVSSVISEGDGGFHLNKEATTKVIKQVFLEYLDELSALPIEQVVKQREKKYRSF